MRVYDEPADGQADDFPCDNGKGGLGTGT